MSYTRRFLASGSLLGVFCLALPCLASAAGAAPTGLRVPALAVDDHSAVLVWQKPADYAGVVDYRVYLNGKAVGTARTNAARFSSAAPYVKAFYATYKGDRQVKIDQHSFTAEGLKPDTEYRFSVRAVHADGSLSAPSQVLKLRTTPPSPRCDITAHGAVGDARP